MRARDSNNATWYMIRYAENFTPEDPSAPNDPSQPNLEPTLFYDDGRHVLELIPESTAEESKLLPPIAVDADGEVYSVDAGQIMVGCGEHSHPLLCEPQVLAGPRGLALDRRGYLYVADARARRVVVLLPEDGSVQDILNTVVLHEPVDVATSPSGRIYVADRAGGQVAVYSARHQCLGQFVTRNAEGLPQEARPIAVMVDADETVLVADAGHPRLLHFTPFGEPLADVQLTSMTSRLDGGELAVKTLYKLYGVAMPRFVVGGCFPPRHTRDGGARLAEAHRALRLLRLRLARRFASSGIFISAALDSGTPGTTWHRVRVDADIPEGSEIIVETATSDARDGLDLGDDAIWSAPLRKGQVIAISEERPEQLIQSRPGRYLWLRARLTSNGNTTPSLRALQVLYPRHSYLDLLPRVYRQDPDGRWFMERFLALFEGVFTGIEDRYEEFSRHLNSDAAPLEVINWLACLVDLSFDPSWPLERRRALVGRAMELYRKRGTPEGIRLYVEIYTGKSPEIVEAFLRRPIQPSFLGRLGSVLGCPLHLSAASPDMTPEEELLQRYAHRFSVFVYLDDVCETETQLAVIDRIVEVSKPAHTVHTLHPVYPDARVELQSTLGLDLVVGAAEAPRTQLGGCPTVPRVEATGSILGADSVLGERRPAYVRPLVQPL